MYDDALPTTGAGVLLVGGHEVGLPPVVTIAAGALVAGLFLYRLATRGKRAEARD